MDWTRLCEWLLQPEWKRDEALRELAKADLAKTGMTAYLSPFLLEVLSLPACEELRALGVDAWQRRSLREAFWKHPALRKLETLTVDCGPFSKSDMERFVELSPCPELRTLSLRGGTFGDAGLARLVASPQASKLEHLHLEGCGLTDKGLRALAASPHLRSLRTLFLRDEGISLAGVAAVLASEALPALRDLALIEFSEEGLEELSAVAPARLERLQLWGPLPQKVLLALATAPAFAKLRELEFLGHLRDVALAEAFAHSATLSGLERLTIHTGSQLLEPAFEVLVRGPSLGRLRYLSFESAKVGPWVGKHLASSPALTSLRELHLTRTRSDSSTAKSLAKSDTLAGLETLELFATRPGDDGVAALAKGKLRALRTLGLSCCGLTHASAAALARATSLGSLETLALSSNKLGAKGAAALAAATGLGKLQSLDLWGAQVRATGARLLVESKAFPELRELQLADCGLSEEVLAELRAHPTLGRCVRNGLER